MTVSTTNVSDSAIGNGSNKVFYFTWQCSSSDWVKTYVDGVEATPTVLLNADQAASPGGRVTFTNAPANNAVVLIRREVPLTQEVNYAAYDSFPAETHEAALDRVTMQVQDEAGIRELVDDEEEAARLAGDATLTAALAVEASVRAAADQSIIRSGSRVSLADDSFVTATGATEARTLADRFAAVVNVKDYGAQGNGVADDTAAILAAAAVVTSRSKLLFPPGNYVFSNGATGIELADLDAVSIVGEGATITFGTNANFCVLTDCTDVTVTGLKFKGTMSNSQRYVGNAEQGRIIPVGCNGVNIYGNTWEDTAGAVFIQAGTKNLRFHGNSVIRTHAGIQSSSAAYSDITITDNYFLGHIYESVDVGSDDQIALFGEAAGRVVISGNIIDKQGPTNFNQARGICIAVGTGSSAHFIVANNVVVNVATTRTASCRAAIIIEGTASYTASKVVLYGNVIANCNAPIQVEAYVSKVQIIGNIVDGAVYLANAAVTTGRGVSVTAGGALAEVTIVANQIFDAETGGIEVVVSDRLIISGNYIRDSGGRGIGVDGCDDLVIAGNHISGSTSTGLAINNCQNIAVSGNIVVGGAGRGITLSGAAVTGTITGNVSSGNGSDNFRTDSVAYNLRMFGNHGWGLPSYTDNAAALAAGLVAGMNYRTATGVVMEVY